MAYDNDALAALAAQGTDNEPRHYVWVSADGRAEVDLGMRTAASAAFTLVDRCSDAAEVAIMVAGRLTVRP